ncbi:hypothetical protein V3W47_16500 [Deinococcus sp. YIM 134068]|uniref:hypothetical protein n=1 Tax=Deinococcus lichenicola TaxID=3118910 RepID=UPI002F95742F
MNDQLGQHLEQLTHSEQHRLFVALQKNFIALSQRPELIERARQTTEDEVRSWTEKETSEQVHRARQTVDLVWQEGISVLAQRYINARGESGVDFRGVYEDLSELLWVSVIKVADQEEASFHFIDKFLKAFAIQIGPAIARLFGFKYFTQSPIFRFVTLIIALVRFMSMIRDGCGVLLRRPLSIPLTVQPCAP